MKEKVYAENWLMHQYNEIVKYDSILKNMEDKNEPISRIIERLFIAIFVPIIDEISNTNMNSFNYYNPKFKIEFQELRENILLISLFMKRVLDGPALSNLEYKLKLKSIKDLINTLLSKIKVIDDNKFKEAA